MLAREAADLSRLVPGAVDKVRSAFEDMKAGGWYMAVGDGALAMSRDKGQSKKGRSTRPAFLNSAINSVAMT